ncbi:phospholipase A2 inhibitor gamma subunit B-like [Spea bombifrons]|uniref:phospholipase A2 inhibitor gamma subunit B-like n=1 Tax=Spea bombifrons TaxID=233779 RepID=UPI00234AFE49|nr:phospholipase A2 inhibitor gamma subunit B-like [Spea bombifrons]
MNALVSLCMLAALAATGESLSCTKCMSLSGPSCTGASVTCPSDNACATAYSVTVVDGAISPVFTKDCAPRSQCNVTGSITFLYGKVKIATACCETDDCNSTVPALPSDTLQPNGLTCRTCASDESLSCYTADTMQCWGAENKCLRLQKKITGYLYVQEAIRGCATESVCSVLGNQQSSFGGLNIDMKVFCSNGSLGLNSGFHFSSIISLVLMTFLFL